MSELQPTRNCNTCPFWRRLGSKFKGRRIPGGFGKCIRLDFGETCTPVHVRRGIGGGGSDWQPKATRRKEHPQTETNSDKHPAGER